jgi:UDP-N-acetylmuramate dehydrogenase
VPKIPVFHKSGDNLWKVSAAWLIENSGISKGFELGSAKISSKHVLAITNPGRATTSDILKLQHFIEDAVYKTFNIKLEREPIFIGTI